MNYQISISSYLEFSSAVAVNIKGVGLVRAESLLLSQTDIHPKELLSYSVVKLKDLYFDEIVKIANLAFPKPVRFRFSDIRSHESKFLKHGDQYEVEEPNPMLGWRGLGRLLSDEYLPLLKIEFESAQRAHESGLENLSISFPFIRSWVEFDNAVKYLNVRNMNIWPMIEVPQNLQDERFIQDKRITGYMIGVNDLFQLFFGKDRDNSYFDAPSVDELQHLALLINEFAFKAKGSDKKISVCGELCENIEFVNLLDKSLIDDVTVGILYYINKCM